MPFRHPVDVANRALQHLGATRISESLGFTENSKNAAAMSFAWDKLRRVELRNNLWKFSTRQAVLRPLDTTSMLIAPAVWSNATSYRPGAIVSDEGNTLWMSNFPSNLNNTPGNSFFWESYFGPLAAQPWDEDLEYSAGEIVYTYDGDGTYSVFRSLEGSNTDDPETATDWDATVTYMKNQVVDYLGTAFISLIDLNLNQTPSATPGPWASGTTYASGNQVYGSDGYIYTSAQNGNVGHDPTTDNGTWWTNTGDLKAWTSTLTGGTGSKKWLDLSPILLTAPYWVYPVGSGPATHSASKNVFRLPAGFLRMAPQDPKAGSVSYLGAPSGRAYSDWLLEGDFIVSRDVEPIMLRFIADIQDVSAMDDLFCEGLAARMAFATCEEITQSITKQSACAAAYKEFMGQARRANAIEIGAIEPAEDDYIVARA